MDWCGVLKHAVQQLEDKMVFLTTVFPNKSFHVVRFFYLGCGWPPAGHAMGALVER